MKRKITSKLYEWKNMLNGRMPLLIYGAYVKIGLNQEKPYKTRV